jgi:hypothetical protein
MKHLTLLTLLLTTTSLLGCAKDQTLQDWRQSKVDEQLSKIQSVSGVYRGNISAKSDGSPLGSVELELQPDVKIGSSSDGLTTEGHAGLKGRLLIDGQNKAIVIFNEGWYDATQKTFQLSATIDQKNGQPAQIEIAGTVSGDTVVGRVEAFGYPEAGGSFSVKRDLPMPVVPASLRLSGDTVPASQVSVYSSNVRFSGSTTAVPVDLVLLEHKTTNEQEMLDLFFPIKTIDVSLNLGEGRTVFFQNAEWDRGAGTLLGVFQGTQATSGARYAALSCNRLEDINAWNCSYTNHQRKTLFTAIFKYNPDQTPVSQTMTIAGTYRGSISSADGSRTIGSVELLLEPDPVVDNSTGLVSQPDLALRAKLILYTRGKSVAIFKNGSYDPTTADIKFSGIVQQRNGTDTEVDLIGKFNDGTITGSIQAFGYPEEGGSFSLVRDATLPEPPKVEQEDLIETYTSTITFPGDKEPRNVEMMIINHRTNSEQALLDLFMPMRFVDVSMTFTLSGISVFMQNAQLDRRSGTLLGQSQTLIEGSPAGMALDCESVAIDKSQNGWKCTYTSTMLGRIFTSTFKPKR